MGKPTEFYICEDCSYVEMEKVDRCSECGHTEFIHVHSVTIQYEKKDEKLKELWQVISMFADKLDALEYASFASEAREYAKRLKDICDPEGAGT